MSTKFLTVLCVVFVGALCVVAFSDEPKPAAPVPAKNIEITTNALNGAMQNIDTTLSQITGVLRGGVQRGLTRDEVTRLQQDTQLITAALNGFIQQQKDAAATPKPPVAEAPETAPKQ